MKSQGKEVCGGGLGHMMGRAVHRLVRGRLNMVFQLLDEL